MRQLQRRFASIRTRQTRPTLCCDGSKLRNWAQESMAATTDRRKHTPFTVGVAMPFQAAFSLEELDRIREGLMPAAMEDKWFGCFEEPHLFPHRSDRVGW